VAIYAFYGCCWPCRRAIQKLSNPQTGPALEGNGLSKPVWAFYLTNRAFTSSSNDESHEEIDNPRPANFPDVRHFPAPA